MIPPRIKGEDYAVAPFLARPASPLGAALPNGLVTRQASMVSYNTVFAWMAAVTLLLIPPLLTMRAAQVARAPRGPGRPRGIRLAQSSW